MKLIIGNDHAGVELKNAIVKHLTERGFEVHDTGCGDGEKADYPDIAAIVANAIAGKEYDMGFLVCGTGIGMSMAANRISGVRAAAVSEAYSATYARLHNNANILCLGARVIGEGTALILVDLFLDTPFDTENPRHQMRVNKLK